MMLEVFNNLFMSIAEQMGVTLQNTASSVNIKERLDFSCAVFDRTGALVANAPHMPVHLGSMDRSVETVIRLNQGDIHPGDVFALNAPYNGGTHLPDITVVTPGLRRRRQGDPLLLGLARPPRRRRRHGAGLDDAAGDDRRRGRRADRQFPHRRSRHLHGEGTVRAADRPPLPCPQRGAERRRPQGADRRQREGRAPNSGRWSRISGSTWSRPIWATCRTTPPKACAASSSGCPTASAYEYATDTGQMIKVKISVDREKREATVDFTGTSPVMKNNFNAPEPVARAAVLYAFRVMVEDMIPMNAGCLQADQHRHPRGLHAEACLSGGGGRRQCRDLAARDQRDVRRDGRHGQRARHDEQPHLRQRQATSTTRRSARARRPAA